MDNILNHVKTVVGDPLDETIFNVELLMQINGVVAKLSQLGVVDYETLVVDENTVWPDTGGPQLNNLIQLYLTSKVSSEFDKTANETVRKSTDSYLLELEGRIMLEAGYIYEVTT